MLPQKRPDSQPPTAACGPNCFLHKIDPEVLASLPKTPPRPMVGRPPKVRRTDGGDRSLEEAASSELPMLIYISSTSEEESSSSSDSEASSCSESDSSSEMELRHDSPAQLGTSRKSARLLPPFKGKPPHTRQGGVPKQGAKKLADAVKGEKEVVVPEESGLIPKGWNGQEVTMFRMLQPIFGHNYCTIAKMLDGKTCHQVCECI